MAVPPMQLTRAEAAPLLAVGRAKLDIRIRDELKEKFFSAYV